MSSESDVALVKSLRPSQILYFYDEPLIFFVDAGLMPLLCVKVDEYTEGSEYLAVATSESSVEQLKSGKLSLRAAFYQPWCWLLRTTESFDVINARGVSREQVPADYFPAPGLGLHSYHGFIDDEFSRSVKSSYLTFAFKGGTLGRATMPFGTFKSLVDEAYSSIKKIFSPPVGELVPGGLGEAAINKILSIPVHEPQFASLSISIDRPAVSIAALKRNIALDRDLLAQHFDKVGRNFADQTLKIQKSARAGGLSIEMAYSDISILEIVSQIVPDEHSDFDRLEISGDIVKADEKKIVINAEEGQQIRDVYRSLNTNARDVYGTIVELNLRSNTFVIRNDTGREITCNVGTRALSAAMTEFQNGSRIGVNGKLTERTRRDVMQVDSITLPNGTVIARRE